MIALTKLPVKAIIAISQTITRNIGFPMRLSLEEKISNEHSSLLSEQSFIPSINWEWKQEISFLPFLFFLRLRNGSSKAQRKFTLLHRQMLKIGSPTPDILLQSKEVDNHRSKTFHHYTSSHLQHCHNWYCDHTTLTYQRWSERKKTGKNKSK